MPLRMAHCNVLPHPFASLAFAQHKAILFPKMFNRHLIGGMILGCVLANSAPCQISLVPGGQTNVIVDVPADLSPSADDMFHQAVSLEGEKQYARAAQLLGDLIQFHPQDARIEESLYRLAECYRGLGRFQEAANFLKLSRDKFPNGQWCLAGYLLEGEMLAADGKWSAAKPPLQEASKSPEDKIRFRALYLLILATEQTDSPADSRPYLESLLKITENNPYVEFAQIRLARVLTDSGEVDTAAKLLRQILATTQDPAIRAEAAVRAGNICYDQKQFKDALGFYEIVRRTEAPEFWKKLAQLGLLQANFSMADYTSVIRLYNDVQPQFPEKTMPQVFFLTAEAYRLLKQPKDALTFYDRLLKDYPASDVAEPASWGRLLVLQTLKDPRFTEAVPAFIASFPHSQRIPLAQLMRADNAYLAGFYSPARTIYAEIADNPTIKALPPDAYAGVLARWGRCCYLLKEYDDATRIFSEFLRQYPHHPSVPDILCMQTQSQQILSRTDDALASANQLLDEFPDYLQRESILWQDALLAGNKRDYKLMSQRLDELTQKYPKTKVMPEAQYWLGYSLRQIGDSKDAVPHLKQARLLNPNLFFESATQILIRIALDAQNLSELTEEVSLYESWREDFPSSAPVSPDVHEWIAQQLASGKDPAKAEPYYRKAIAQTKDAAQKKRAQLGLAMLMSKIKNWGGAIEEWNKYIKLSPEDANRSSILESLSQAYIGAARFDEAQKLAEQILRQNPEGEYNARGRMLLGDIAFAQHNYSEAAKIYSAVALLIDDPVLTPLAKEKAAEARRRSTPEDQAPPPPSTNH